MQFREPREETYTQWHNPLKQEQIVDIFHDNDSMPTRYRWKAGETKSLPSRFDHAIHRVHNGVIIGGLAPQLRKVGSSAKLDPALDHLAQQKKEAAASAAAALLQQRAAAAAMVEAEAMRVSAAEEQKANEDRAAAAVAAIADDPDGDDDDKPFMPPAVEAEPGDGGTPVPPARRGGRGR